MRECLILVTAVAAFGSITNAALYPWIPIAPWWVRAPDKDTPPVVSIQQSGGNYAYSTAEGKAFQALTPAAAVQPPPVAAVHVQSVPAVAVHYLPGGQAVLVSGGPLASAANPSADTSYDEGLETTTELGEEEASTDDPAAVAVPEQPREPAPVTEHQEENDALQGS